ncbi:hypothetical protein AAVH_29360 [Aphelenchoides avenae]|nr:hypothetical protein AAVH_29360 [Aphelenchus avenae]
MRLHHAFYLLSVTIGYMAIIWCQLEAMKYLKRYGQAFRESTQRAHREFNRALIVLALTPLASLLPSGLMCGANLVGTSFGPISVFVTIGMTSITLVNPIATIAIIKPYRHALLAVVFGRKSKNAVSAASSHFEGLDPATTIAVNAGTRGPSAAVC